MKKLQTILFALLCVQSVQAQRKAFIPEPGEGIAFNTSSLMLVGDMGGFDPTWRANSQEFQLFREHTIGLSHFGIALGVGYSGHFYHGNLHVDVAQDGTQTLENLNGRAYNSNRLATEYADGLLELRYRSRANRKGRYTRLYIGGMAGYLVDSYSYLESDGYRVKFYNIGGFSAIRFGGYVKAGRGPFNLYYYCGLNPVVASGVLLDEFGAATQQNVGLSLTL